MITESVLFPQATHNPPGPDYRQAMHDLLRYLLAGQISAQRLGDLVLRPPAHAEVQLGTIDRARSALRRRALKRSCLRLPGRAASERSLRRHGLYDQEDDTLIGAFDVQADVFFPEASLPASARMLSRLCALLKALRPAPTGDEPLLLESHLGYWDWNAAATRLTRWQADCQTGLYLLSRRRLMCFPSAPVDAPEGDLPPQTPAYRLPCVTRALHSCTLHCHNFRTIVKRRCSVSSSPPFWTHLIGRRRGLWSNSPPSPGGHTAALDQLINKC